MACEIVKVVEGMLRQAQQVLGLLFLELVRLNRDTQRKDWSACLNKEDVSKPARTGNSQEGRRRVAGGGGFGQRSWRRTLPSAQSIISSKGKLARGIVVVCHHIGKPRKRTINQKESIICERLRISDGLSGGGCFRPVLGVGGEASTAEATCCGSGWSSVLGVGDTLSAVTPVSIVVSTTSLAATVSGIATLATWHRDL